MLNINTAHEKHHLFFIVGLPASGKTHLAKLFAQENNFQFIDLDEAIELAMNLSVSQIFAKFGEIFFREKEQEQLNNIFLIKQNTIVATGGGTPCYCNNMELMNQYGVTIWLNESLDIIEKRIAALPKKRPLINSQSIINEYLIETFAVRKNFYEKSKHVLNSKNIFLNNLQNIIIKYV